MFSIRSYAVSFFRCFFDQSGWGSRKFISKSSNCEQAGLPLKRRNIFFVIITKQICFPMICVSMISICISVFGFLQLTVAVSLLLLKHFDRKYFSVKTTSACIFSTVKRKQNFLSAISRTPKFGPSSKAQTLYMTLSSGQKFCSIRRTPNKL